MYITAQKVEGRESGRVATNVFIYMHGTPGRPIVRSLDQIATIAEQVPGTLANAEVMVAPGGNAILSYLDVVAPDGTSTDEIQRAVQAFRPDGPQESRLVGDIAIRFAAHRTGSGDPSAEYSELSARLLALLRHPRSAGATHRPLQIIVRGEDKDDVSFWLDDESERRVVAIGGKSTGMTLKVARDTKDDFEQAFGSVYRHVLPVLTNLELEHILLLGGVVFRGEQSGRVLWRWPKTAVDARPALDMKSLESVVTMARIPQYQAVRADAMSLLKRELEQSAASNPRLPTLARWLRELEEIEKNG
jgi:hypothetical protein